MGVHTTRRAGVQSSSESGEGEINVCSSLHRLVSVVYIA